MEVSSRQRNSKSSNVLVIAIDALWTWQDETAITMNHVLYTTHEEIFAKYGHEIVMCERLPEMSVPQMGNQMYMAHAADEAAAKEFIEFVQARN